tara:strand:+ start:2951 stop:3385 length:435 start_codon:yes stop_codon:yes gene_type:complete
MIEGLKIIPLKIINTEGGDVYHVMKDSEEGFSGFGEAYFSSINPGAIKAWKRHHNMTLNLAVPTGEIKFVIYDDRNPAKTLFNEYTLSKENYCRLTIPPMVWVGFKGLGKITSMLINIANMPHDQNEFDRKDIDKINFNWKENQ